MKDGHRIVAIENFIALLGPLLALRFSWIDNSEIKDDEAPPSSGNMPLILLLVAAGCLLTPSCENLSVGVMTPQGNASYKDGVISIIPRAKTIEIPIDFDGK